VRGNNEAETSRGNRVTEYPFDGDRDSEATSLSLCLAITGQMLTPILVTSADAFGPVQSSSNTAVVLRSREGNGME
jgi:hypothetical protein